MKSMIEIVLAIIVFAFLAAIVCGCRQTIVDQQVFDSGGNLISHTHFGQTVFASWTEYGDGRMTSEPNHFEATIGKAFCRSDPNSIAATGTAAGNVIGAAARKMTIGD